MATPHVAGAAALLMSVNPALKGHPDQVGDLLRNTAVTAGVTDPSNSGCGGLTMADHPNYQVGWGRIDVLAAAQAAMGSNHTVTPSVAGGNGSISPSTAQSVADGATIAFTLTPVADYHIVTPVGGTCAAGSLAGSVYTTGAITADCTVIAGFAIDTWTVSASAGAHGTITPASQTIDAGTNATLTVTPDASYVVADVVGDTCNVTPSGADTYATDAIHADCTVTATFAPIGSDMIFVDGFDGF
jgi:hypothetical protein